jgi:hypothetical protein
VKNHSSKSNKGIALPTKYQANEIQEGKEVVILKK